ncbi:MAG: hypothetical protein EKK45_19215 [Curvibacter sp.]|nr:MAG: hypothetical protein EKK45_19215 [Curvibacter sp.]
MLYLTTGANGTGKTLFTLKEVREKQLKENRPVYHNGRFTLTVEGEGFGWKQVDFKDWQDCPDGAIFLIDECHNDMPKLSSGAPVPEYIKALGEHRRRGFDFYLITQHPQNISTFVRKLIGAPGWHRHLKRNFGADLVSQLEWAYVNDSCEKPGASRDGVVTMRAFPKEVYAWYSSAVLHTGKKRIPRQVLILAACLIIIPVLGFMGYRSLMRQTGADKVDPAPSKPGQVVQDVPRMVKTREDWLRDRVPRVDGLPQTAPVYDKVTEPVDAPYPAACIESKRDGCKCYSQQATLLTVAADLCRMIVQRGFFMDWASPSVAASLKHEADVRTRREADEARAMAVRNQQLQANQQALQAQQMSQRQLQPLGQAMGRGAPGAMGSGLRVGQASQEVDAAMSALSEPVRVADAQPAASGDDPGWQFIRQRVRR